MDTRAAGFCALDFGTSNSVLVVRESEDNVTFLREKSLLLFPDDLRPEYSTGNRALSLYEASGGRGRLLRSLKSLLPHQSFEGSRIGGSFRTLEHLLTLFLADLRERASNGLGRQIRGVVLGRPVRFSPIEEAERLAEERLLISARAAGFDEVKLVMEPVAAAAAYRRSLTDRELTLVADLGAGTSDFSVARLEPVSLGSEIGALVLSNSSVSLGGDDIDGLIMWHKVTEYLGRGTKYYSNHKWLDVPARVFRDLCERETLAFLLGGRTRDDLNFFIQHARNPEGLRRLAQVIDYNLGDTIFRELESSKIQLSDAEDVVINIRGGVWRLDERITRSELSGWLEEIETSILQCLDEVLRTASVRPADFDSVILTGGSSLIPAIRNLFIKIFGKEKLRSSDPFDSVALGLLELIP